VRRRPPDTPVAPAVVAGRRHSAILYPNRVSPAGRVMPYRTVGARARRPDRADAPFIVVLASLAMAQQPAGRRAGAAPVLERHLAVDDRPAVALRLLDTPPLAAREVIRDLARPLRQHFQVLQIVDDDVCRGALPQEAAVLETRRMRRVSRTAASCGR